jgi:Flp pilus assembly protein TadG
MSAPSHVIAFSRSQSGAVAIEFVLILPLLILVFLGMIDLTGLASDSRRVSYAASVAADLVTRQQTQTTPDQIADVFVGVDLVMAGARADPARVEISNFRLQNGNVNQIWTRNNARGEPCGAPATAGFNALMADGNDLVVAVVCTEHTPMVNQFMGETTIGAALFGLRAQVVMRPRHSLRLNCPAC